MNEQGQKGIQPWADMSRDCDLMRNSGLSHCGHIENGNPCCQCGYVRAAALPEGRDKER